MKKKKILIVNCYLDELRIPIRRKSKVPQSMAPAFLAGAFSPDLCEVKLYNEQFSGPLESEAFLSWPDMLVLTGLNTAFDRMLHLTAYARTKNRSVIIVAGGPAIRALFHYSKEFFDFSCLGDIEQIADIIEESFGKDYVSKDYLEKGWLMPRYDLANWMGIIGYVESSRNCYCSCNFCSLTAENAKYRQYDQEYLRRQFEACGKRRLVYFLDNNFSGTSRQFLIDRIALVREFWRKKYFFGWGASLSNEFFINEENLIELRDSGCVILFSGIETFDKESLVNFNKFQNTRMPQVDIIRKCLNAGISFYYGLVFDVSSRPISDLREELEFIIDTPEITLPSFVSLAVPMLGTPFFYENVKQNKILPNIKIRDLDSTTLTLKPIDPMPDVIKFIREVQNLIGYRKKVIRQAKKFFHIYKNILSFWPMAFAMYNVSLLCTPKLSTATTDVGGFFVNGLRKRSRTYVGSTEPLDTVYKPAFPVNSRYEHYFKPTMLTDHEGNLLEALHADLLKK